MDVAATLNLADQAASEGVLRFVFMNSIKANGESTSFKSPFISDELPSPKDPYGTVKHEAEQGLRQIEAETRMEVVITRPLLVYGPSVNGNFLRFMPAIDKRRPLPLGFI